MRLKILLQFKPIAAIIFSLFSTCTNAIGFMRGAAPSVTPDNTVTFTNKTYDTAATGNVFKINTQTINAISGTGSTIPTTNQPAFTGLYIADGTDQTKRVLLDASSVSTATTRNVSFQNLAGTLALTANNLSVFASTTSAQLFGIISDETGGSGNLVGSASPTFTGTITSGEIDSSANINANGASNVSGVFLNVKTATDHHVAAIEQASVATIAGLTDAGAAASLRVVGNTLIFSGNGSANQARFNSSGELLIGTTTDSGAYLLQANGSILATGASFTGLAASGAGDVNVCLTTGNVLTAGATCAASTARIKTDIQPLTHGLDYLSKMKAVTFTYNGFAGRRMGQDAIGLIAEDSASIDPRLAIMEQDGKTPLNVDERAYIAVLVKSVQELNVEVKRLKRMCR